MGSQNGENGLRHTSGAMRPFWRFLLATVVLILINAVLFFLLRPGAGLDTRGLAFSALALALTVTAFSVMSRRLDRATHPLAYIGLPASVPRGRLAAIGLVYGALMVTLALLSVAAIGSVTFRVQFTTSVLATVVVQLAVLAFAAMSEEVAFRGYPFHRLIESIGTVPAVLCYAAMFALPHLMNPGVGPGAMINTAAAGAFFATSYLLTRSLWLPWGIHAGWNAALSVIYGLNVSGVDAPGIVSGSMSGPGWLTGGAYGVEAGISGTVALAIGFAGLFPLVRRLLPPTAIAPHVQTYVLDNRIG